MVDPESPMPLYHQLKSIMIRKITDGQWVPAEAIPPERELIAQYQVSRTTVRQAIDELVAAGLLYRLHGKGTFVAARRTNTLADLTGFAEELELRGAHPHIQLLGCQMDQPFPRVLRDLGLEPASLCWRVSRLVSVDGEPLFADNSFFPPALSAALTPERLSTTAMYRILEEDGIVLVRGSQEIGAVALESDLARLLGVDPGTPGLTVTRVTYSRHERPVEWSRAVYRSDRYQYLVDLRRGPPRSTP